jgi:hypothetical protein
MIRQNIRKKYEKNKKKISQFEKKNVVYFDNSRIKVKFKATNVTF